MLRSEAWRTLASISVEAADDERLQTTSTSWVVLVIHGHLIDLLLKALLGIVTGRPNGEFGRGLGVQADILASVELHPTANVFRVCGRDEVDDISVDQPNTNVLAERPVAPRSQHVVEHLPRYCTPGQPACVLHRQRCQIKPLARASDS